MIVRTLSGTFRSAAVASLCALASALTGTSSHAQEAAPSADTLALQRLRPRIGVFGVAGINLHSGSHVGAPEAPSCLAFDEGSFEGGSGFGGGGGLLFELPLSEMFSVMVRGGYYGLGADDRATVAIAPIRVGTEVVTAFSEYSFDNSLAAIDADVTFGVRPFDFPLTFRIGPEMSTYVTSSFEQAERAASPSELVFIGPNDENTKIRNEYAGEHQNTALRVAGVIGADYELPLNVRQTLLLAPEISYSLAFTDVRSDMNWQANQLRIGAALKFSFPVPVAPPPPREQPPPPDPMLAAALDVTSVSADGVEQQNVPIRVEEFINAQTRAFLNYVFFEEGESKIPERYIVYLDDARRRFNTAELHNKSKLEVYYQSLNVLGSRMIEYPEARITLTGTNANVGVEQNNTALSRSRAESVRDYLVRAWGIDTKRIAIEARNLPAVPSNPDSADGIEENRRVEITSNRIEILAPVTTTDTLRTVDPPIIRLRGTQTVESGPGRWKITLRQGERTIGEMEGAGTPQPAIDFNILDDRNRIPLTEEPVIATYQQWDERGVNRTATDEARVEQVTIRRKREERLGDLIFERYNLITFEFDKATLSPVNRMIANLIKARIRPTSEVEIVGYTDRLGMADHNLELSRARALSTADALGVPAANARGAGENESMFDNELPEGRFLSRTVDVTVKTRVAAGE
jgi:outer membrane protein OmpA-like peptidoglycan-associated protein